MKKPENMPVCKSMCATCPFRDGSPYADLAPLLAASAISSASRICHSTGSNAIKTKTGKKEHLCRGARSVQLGFMAAMNVIENPTDEAWNEKRVQAGMKPQIIKDP